MAVLCRMSLRVSWMLCLLISSTTCLPAPKGYGSGSPNLAPIGIVGWLSTSDSSDPNAGRLDRSGLLSRVYYPISGSVPQIPAAQSSNEKLSSMGNVWDNGIGSSFFDPRPASSFSSRYVSNAGVPGGEYNAGAYDIPATYGNGASGYDNSRYSNVGLGTAFYSSGSTDGDGRYTQSSSDVEERPEPVFSDVSNLEPVYSYRSRSSYRKGRNMFVQSHYTPGEWNTYASVGEQP
ncbi:uncharacterized protein LOC115013743 [Cottoperca gobio]|uniref:Uncharacterized protein LOC115013743 n=1 Tax=Cottoperca gobio TaxID=56716 RepID=A0A6J2QEJ3_COTGO|nr:uncharacterized protein LOC115013743 [Cottoperca gobio]